MTGNSSVAPTGDKLSNREIISYSLPRFGSAAMFLVVSVYLAKFYTDTVGLAAGFIAWTFLIARFWDGFTDPLMGYISDGTKFRMGRRRPYFLISAIPVSVAYFMLWSPPKGLQDWTLFAYLTAMYLLTYTFWTVFSIPHNSLGAELTMDYHERTRLTGWREAFGVAGTIVGTMAPFYFARMLGGRARGFSYLAALTGALTAVFIFVAFFNLKENPEFQKQRSMKLREGLKVIAANRPFRTLVLAFGLALMGNACVPPLTPYMADYVVKIPGITRWIILAYLLAVLPSIVFWTRLSRRIGKKEAWTYALLFSGAVFLASMYYHEGTWVVWFILAGLAGFGYGCTLALGYSMMADVIDYDELETGRRREGAYFGVWFFLEKGAVGITIFIAMQALHFTGYVPNQPQTPLVFWTLKFLYSILPAVCFGLCYFLIRNYPITHAEHTRIRAEIEAKKGAGKEGAE